MDWAHVVLALLLAVHSIGWVVLVFRLRSLLTEIGSQAQLQALKAKYEFA